MTNAEMITKKKNKKKKKKKKLKDLKRNGSAEF